MIISFDDIIIYVHWNLNNCSLLSIANVFKFKTIFLEWASDYLLFLWANQI